MHGPFRLAHRRRGALLASSTEPGARVDIAILDAIQEHLRSPLLDTVMLFATHLGDLALVWLVAAAVLIALPRYRRFGVAVFVAVAVTAALGMLVLKPLFGRARPFVTYEFAGLLIPPPSGDSFPSNHSMVSFAAAAALCCLPGKGKGVVAVKVAAVLVACLIAFSRLYLYVHYPTDILAGAVIGAAVGIGSVWAVGRLWPGAPPQGRAR